MGTLPDVDSLCGLCVIPHPLPRRQETLEEGVCRLCLVPCLLVASDRVLHTVCVGSQAGSGEGAGACEVVAPTHLCQQLQDGPSVLHEHIHQCLDEARAFLVMPVGDVSWGFQRLAGEPCRGPRTRRAQQGGRWAPP